jgi:hypothetical protein
MAPEIIIADVAEPSNSQVAVPYGVPRRFGIGTILIVTAAFAGLLGLLRWLGAPPLVVGFLVGFVSLVGLGQAVLFRGRRPRQASIVTGIACFAVYSAVVLIYGLIRDPSLARIAVVMLVWTMLCGSLCGYLAGCFVAAVFLVMDAVERLLGRLRSKKTSTGASEVP